jgi:hypothetical protein
MNHLPRLAALVADWGAFELSPGASLSDAEVLATQRQLGEARRMVDALSARTAAMIDHRSRPELGHDGLAQRTGARTPQILVQHLTGLGRREASTLVRVGALIDVPMSADAPSLPAWRMALRDAVDAGMSVEAAEVIRSVLAELDAADDVLLGAASGLVADAKSLTLERLAARARQVRDSLDEEGVAEREQALRDRRCLHTAPQRDGTLRIWGILDPESAAEFIAIFDAATSPRRGGPRFVDRTARVREQNLLSDPRTPEQLALDSFIDLLKLGVAADTTHIVGAHRPAVSVHVTLADLDRRAGSAQFEGQTASVSVATAERHACTAGVVPIQFDDDKQVVNVGRSQRLFTHRQRIGLAARDGGCRFPECERPPSWTEAHHIDEWDRDHGRTDIADGVLLCRHHHLLVHNNGWRVTRTGGEYFVIPPKSMDYEQTPIPAPAKGVANAYAA